MWVTSSDSAVPTVTVPSIGTPWMESFQPSSEAMCRLPAAARALCISMSGLSPGDTLRKTLRISESPKMSEVLLCSAPTTIDGPPDGISATPGSRWKASPGTLLPDRIPSTHSDVQSLSCSAS